LYFEAEQPQDALAHFVAPAGAISEHREDRLIVTMIFEPA